MEKNYNSASRLYEILQDALAQPINSKMENVWAEVFELQSESGAKILYVTAKIIELVEQVKKDIQQLPEIQHSIYLKHINKIETAFERTYLLSQLKDFKQYVDPTTIEALEIIADILKSSFPEKMIDQEELNNLQKEIEELINDVIDSDFPQDLIEIIVKNLEEIRSAVISYRISGVNGLREALEKNLGSVYLNREQFENKKDQASVKRYEKLLKKLGSSISLASNLAQIASFVSGFFLTG